MGIGKRPGHPNETHRRRCTVSWRQRLHVARTASAGFSDSCFDWRAALVSAYSASANEPLRMVSHFRRSQGRRQGLPLTDRGDPDTAARKPAPLRGKTCAGSTGFDVVPLQFKRDTVQSGLLLVLEAFREAGPAEVMRVVGPSNPSQRNVSCALPPATAYDRNCVRLGTTKGCHRLGVVSGRLQFPI
eukprot:scaffold2991_cov403-Prasinococcus_capsulatus_cf.AAC.5